MELAADPGRNAEPRRRSLTQASPTCNHVAAKPASDVSAALGVGVRLYKGRRENKARNDGIAAMLRAGSSWQQIQDATGCSRGTVAKVRKRLDVAPVTGAG